MLNISLQNMPEPSDSERPKTYTPRNPYPTPNSFPQTPAAVFDAPAIFEKFDTDTLFFIFYYQQGTYQQYLAARELKKQSWRYHKKCVDTHPHIFFSDRDLHHHPRYRMAFTSTLMSTAPPTES